MLEAQAVVLQELETATLGVDAREDSVDPSLVAEEAVDSWSAAHEGHVGMP